MNQKHDKEKVLATGLKLFCSQGYSSLGVDEICKTTGMTKGAFYNAFKSKEQFLLDALNAYSQQQVIYLGKRLEDDGSTKAIERLRDLYNSMLLVQPKNQYTGCMVNNIMSELGNTNELVSKTTAIAFESFLQVIEPCVIAAQREGDLNPNIPSKALTELLHSTFYGTLTRAKSLQDYHNGIDTMNLLINSLK